MSILKCNESELHMLIYIATLLYVIILTGKKEKPDMFMAAAFSGAFSVLCTAHHMPAGPTLAPTHLVSKHHPSETTPKYAPHLCQVLLDDFFHFIFIMDRRSHSGSESNVTVF